MKRIAILGSTGSIGKATLEVIRRYSDEFKVEALSAYGNTELLKRQARRFHPGKVAVADINLRVSFGSKIKAYSGIEGLEEIASDKDVDIVVVALSGAAALRPLLAAIAAGKKIALANKEALVMAGALVKEKLKKSKATIVPVDSEQSAIFQCLKGQDKSEVRRLYLTASGGPLYSVPLRKFAALTKEEVLKHPRWKMGRKITVDSATLMNKGLEVIEARWLFDIEVRRIEVLVHRQAIIHSMVEFVDGAVLAQLGITDMALPISYALSYPRRLANNDSALDFLKVKNLTFEKSDNKRFPCLNLAYEAANVGGSAPCVLNAANEVAVEAFLDGRVSFIAIPKIIEKILSSHKAVANPDLHEIFQADGWARQEAGRLI